MIDQLHEYVLHNITISGLGTPDILKHSSEFTDTDKRNFYDIQPLVIEVDSASFVNPPMGDKFPVVGVSQAENCLVLSCECNTPKKSLCEHQVQVLYNLMNLPYLRIFFDPGLRQQKIKEAATGYGMENEMDLEKHFELEYKNKAVEIKPKNKELFPVTDASTTYLAKQLFAKDNFQSPVSSGEQGLEKRIVVFRDHKYYEQFNIELFEGKLSKDGKVKNPLTLIDPLKFIWETEKIEEAKFYSGISKFQTNFSPVKNESDLEGLKAIAKNPLGLDVFCHDNSVSERITATSLIAVALRIVKPEVRLAVDLRGSFYEVSGVLEIDNKSHELKNVKIKYNYFIQTGTVLNLVTNINILRIIDFFKENNPKILIHKSKYEEFHRNILSQLEHQVDIAYSYIKPAGNKEIEELGFDRTIEKMIYLSDRESHVQITPVMKYGNVEVPVFSRKQIYDADQNGNVFTIDRDKEKEIQFTSILLRQHPYFEEQLNDMDYFYLHKEKFLNEDWFLNAFEEWQNNNIRIFGFNEIKGNKLNTQKAKVTVHVSSGTDWFNTSLSVHYGKQKASMKQLYKAVRNKSKFVQLDDGTQGILPKEWMEKMAAYFDSGELAGEGIRTPKNNFADISDLYEEEMLSGEVKKEVTLFQSKFADFNTIQEVAVPAELNATLRDYQKQGLNWLNFMDEFNFGGCLADDMGLGKTVQIIAFILLQRTKQPQNTNLVVVPTSLIFNWQEELAKFAPTIKVHTQYSSDKMKTIEEFNPYEIILTTYGTLLSDIALLKEYRFNYIFLDESQAIKNPESQRYKATRLLQSRNKIVLTGTPIENNTFDIYGQLSFACPGLLGSKKHFQDIYSTPVDKFKETRRAKELQKKISPFILRRTKKQVLSELPDKTEMMIYCEMGAEQRAIYDSFEKEIRDYIAGKSDDELFKSSMEVLKGLTKLRQICDSPAILNGEGFYGNHSAKIEVLMEQIENKSPQHKILVFSQFVSMLDLIKTELENKNIPYEYLTGKTTNRASKVKEFQQNDSVRVFLISLKAGGTGLNLTEADYVYLVDPWWNPAVENQAIDRCYRIGQKKNVIAVRLICPDTIEEKIRKLQESKTELANDLVKTDGSMLKSLTKTDLMAMLS